MMSRNGRYRHCLSRHRIDSLLTLEKSCDTLMLMLNRGGIDVEAKAGRATLAAGDALMIDEADQVNLAITPETEAELFAIEISRCQNA